MDTDTYAALEKLMMLIVAWNLFVCLIFPVVMIGMVARVENRWRFHPTTNHCHSGII